MPSVIFVLPDGSERRVDVAPGTSLMHAAVDRDLPGIVGECGGCATCATCHVVVDAAWAARLPPIGPDEDDMLDFTASPRQPNSRLGCQIAVDASLEGVRVMLPAAD
jgi:2Fe-2S ferredoxin